jgi:hypothetical protein
MIQIPKRLMILWGVKKIQNNRNNRIKTNEDKIEKRMNNDSTFEKLRTKNVKELKTLDELLKEKC